MVDDPLANDVESATAQSTGITAAAASTCMPESPFLRIPGELRNEIYRYALLEDDTIKINKHTKPAQPGMLQTNRQLRKEAGDIYYHENTFLFGISHFEASIYITWCQSSPRRRWCKTTAHVSRSQNWANLLVWLEAYWNHDCGGIVWSEEGKANADAKAATHLFAMVKKMMQRKSLTWEDAREFLEDAHAALAEIKPRWAWRSGSADLNARLQ
ncbi:hypothetical protein B0A54_03193 [Friedmanniomyces endolithicus]|uniref:Uncharacterized protein n=1 Tax=Friedmanniomyces endolithicus TaxID=329885 RepID=A0A4U0V8Y4_9PEZI|nr:hypothetical protein LTS09_009712 [Friedmanniomyces endolithicus]TKA44902.1 hypothetical protein B0A54_03193 [Friedmanniomyces endolithicus]